MIVVKLNEDNFEYDIHSLIKAFYPKEDVMISSHQERSSDAHFFLTVTYNHENQGVSIDYGSICFAFYKEATVDPIFTNEVRVNHSDRTDTKNKLKQCLYELLQNVTKKELPWGTLTGIRPTKIPVGLLEQGKTKDEIFAYLKQTYLMADEKVKLAVDVAQSEHQLLAQWDYKTGYSLYIGIPFCPTTCAYCSFPSYPLAKWHDQVDQYLDCLEQEIDFVAESMKNFHLDTVYIGGGTPTTLLPHQSRRLLQKLKATFDFSGVKEFCVEAGRPDSIDEDKLEVFCEYPITRLSINPQTMKQETLDLIGRHHSAEQTYAAFELARKYGFHNINMDLILGLPEETSEDVRRTLLQVQELSPENLTVHSLAIKRAAKMQIESDKYQNAREEEMKAMVALASSHAKQMNMYPYYLYRQKNMAGNFENVGYAKDGCEGLYNILIMEEKQTIMALGAGASTKLVYDDFTSMEKIAGGISRVARVENVKDITHYITRIEEMIERKRTKMEELGWH